MRNVIGIEEKRLIAFNVIYYVARSYCNLLNTIQKGRNFVRLLV